ncbi:conserved hypothetical protein [Ricinus communis]|uniref:Uncharacterized protein n=1 Tax=Ricinus communis TaxID=3988 RepID=B9TQV4_RICCO|nr:conserved hypothetical protein [Ricinus communis]
MSFRAMAPSAPMAVFQLLACMSIRPRSKWKTPHSTPPTGRLQSRKTGKSRAFAER